MDQSAFTPAEASNILFPVWRELQRKLLEILIIVHLKIWPFKHSIYLMLHNKSTAWEKKDETRLIFKNPRLMKISFPILNLVKKIRCGRTISSSAWLKQIWLSLVLFYLRWLCFIINVNRMSEVMSGQKPTIMKITRKIISAVINIVKVT